MSKHQLSYYEATAKGAKNRPQLIGEHNVDICIIGGGLTGTSAALHLAEAGYQVTLLEANEIGWGASGRNGGQICQGHNMSHEEMLAKVGKDTADALWQTSVDSVAMVKALIARYQIDCDLTPGVLHVASKPRHAEEIKKAVDYKRHVLGYDGVAFYDRKTVADKLGTDRYHGGEWYQDGAHIQPLNFSLGLAAAAEAHGAKLYEHSAVLEYTDGQHPEVITAKGRVTCRYLLFACNGYLGHLNGPAARKIMPINNFIIATEPLPDEVVERINPDRIAVADSKFVVNYYRLSSDKRMLWGGGENYSQHFPKDIAGFVKKHMLETYPELARYRIDYAWGGTLAITLNRMPQIARQQENIFVAHGYSGHGVAMATYAGAIFAKAVQGSLETVDAFEALPCRDFPGGTLLRWPGLVAGMLYYSMLDRLP
ncbi:FAD-binding oxidoreductase [Marinomonas sp. M1K-6]|uniref:FAD-binding oxidoreductase n=1 Tax=Marinomonas profundi TaxID=2726122 RepID=A0A847R0Q6_9GAMM|nr:FAD-binding oxidoreductase [Marinomonas profundi]NLQ17125.1 FAD-binding oxidoreductase [Marinomonas profundi]UDV04679.1 FAD-binding oxidoreductase [Marinomonas profundi]